MDMKNNLMQEEKKKIVKIKSHESLALQNKINPTYKSLNYIHLYQFI